MNTIFQKGRCQACGGVLPQPRRWKEFCSSECRMMRAEFEGFCALEFITTNARWAGSNGCETVEEMMELAVRRLPESEELLATLLIEILEDL
jgi:hypothetical protein